jgi:hypothetical protein
MMAMKAGNMKLQTILTEMKSILESDAPVEIHDLVKNFPTTHKKALQKLWGGKRLVYKGKTLFDHDDFGPAYRGAIKAAEKVSKRGLHLSFSFRDAVIEKDVDISEMQEVYLGYDESEDKLYIGFDAWLDDQAIEEAFDDLYRKSEGEEFDVDSNEPKFVDAWREFRNKEGKSLRGLLFGLDSTDGEHFTADLVYDKVGGFYRGIYRSPFFKSMKLIDLRLD